MTDAAAKAWLHKLEIEGEQVCDGHIDLIDHAGARDFTELRKWVARHNRPDRLMLKLSQDGMRWLIQPMQPPTQH